MGQEKKIPAEWGEQPRYGKGPWQVESYLQDVPPPVLLNAWKHHAGALKERIALAAQGNEVALQELANQLVVIGTELMDLYIGSLTPHELAARVIETLQADNRLQLDAYRAWLQTHAGYQVLTLPEDNSRWVLRLGPEDGRYVHVHPGRWSPATLRVRANVLKSALMILAYTGVHGGDALDVALINKVRKQYLGLSPIGALTGEQGLRGIMAMLRTQG